MSVRRAVAVAVVAAGVVLGAISVAWACSNTAYLEPLSPNLGPRGSEVTVTGSRWSPSVNENPIVGPVEIRWGSQDGPVLASATGASWSVQVTIPDAAPGYYAITAVARDADGQPVGRQARTFRVTAATTTGGGSGSGTTTGPGETATSGTAPADPAAEPVAATDPAQAPPATPATAGPSTPRTNDATPAAAGTPTAITPGVSGPFATARPAASPSAPRPSIPAAGTLTTSGATAAAPAGAASPVAPGPVTDVAPLPEADAVWSTAPPGAERPSLVSEPTGGHRSTVALAVALAAVGVPVLFAGTLVVAVRRRRSMVGSRP